MRGLWVALLLGGCSSIFGLHDPAHVTDGPAGSGDGPPADAPASCLGSGSLAVCFDAPPTAAVTLPTVIDTATSPLCTSTAHWASPQTESCFVVGTAVVVPAGATRVLGERPLVLVATGDLTVTGTLDASSHIADASIGAAADAAACASGTPAMQANTGGGGGAGGSFTTPGGNGGLGANGTSSGGIAGAAIAPSSLHGGCPGQPGAPGGNQTTRPGHGGGALYLLAGSAIDIRGVVAANGSGGSSGVNRAGGGGGGSGGMIVLYAPSIAIAGTLIADGGGGASGADGAQGNDGSDPAFNAQLAPAAGGASGFGGPGGDGYASGVQAQNGGDTPSGTSRGGGGGGGGAGYIRANKPLGNARVSPPVDVVP
ncbi:MAG TPA: hypothetical protein VLT45_03975 [Kofleriaceae bacterium]|nr:hypothetical protein [Kofleriaceae bacterium]